MQLSPYSRAGTSSAGWCDCIQHASALHDAARLSTWLEGSHYVFVRVSADVVRHDMMWQLLPAQPAVAAGFFNAVKGLSDACHIGWVLTPFSCTLLSHQATAGRSVTRACCFHLSKSITCPAELECSFGLWLSAPRVCVMRTGRTCQERSFCSSGTRNIASTEA